MVASESTGEAIKRLRGKRKQATLVEAAGNATRPVD
jgi:hypothetical protein